MSAPEVAHPDGRVELRDTRRIEASPLYNRDLAPVPIALRTWSTFAPKATPVALSTGAVVDTVGALSRSPRM